MNHFDDLNREIQRRENAMSGRERYTLSVAKMVIEYLVRYGFPVDSLSLKGLNSDEDVALEELKTGERAGVWGFNLIHRIISEGPLKGRSLWAEVLVEFKDGIATVSVENQGKATGLPMNEEYLGSPVAKAGSMVVTEWISEAKQISGIL